MGMYDSVWASCPKCATNVEFQSKAGACTLAYYTLDAVPVEIAHDINGDSERCTACGHVLTLSFALPTPDTVPMRVD